MGVVARVAPYVRHNWIGRMESERRAQAHSGVDPRTQPEARAAAIGGKKAERLSELLVPENVALAHAEQLAPAIKDIARLRELAAELEPFLTRQLERLLAQFYK